MKTAAMVAFVALATLGLPASQSGAEAKDDASLLRLRTCQDSWMDWENDPAKTQMFVDGLKVISKRDDRDGSYLPIKPMSILGYDVLQLYPQCVGMGVGYPVIVSAVSTRRNRVWKSRWANHLIAVRPRAKASLANESWQSSRR